MVREGFSILIFIVVTVFSVFASARDCVGDFGALSRKKNPQLAIWRLEDKGHQKLAASLKKRTAETLRTARILSQEQGVEETRNKDLFFLEFEGGIRGVWKPANEGTAKELIAYKLDEMIGANLVPITVEGEFRGHAGVVQLFVRNANPMAEVNPQNLKLFDYLIAQSDRHGDNYLVTRTRTIAIDNEYTFQIRPPTSASPIFQRREIPDFSKFVAEN